MARSRRSHYRSSILPTLFIGGTALGLFGLAGLMVAWAMGAFKTSAASPVDRTGQLAFPALAQPVPAFESISREHLINPQTGQLNIAWLPEATAKVASRDVSQLIGRVLSRDKEPGMVLTERDFLPEGTKPGVSAGIPPGKFAVTIPATGIPGLDQLRHGDRFDLMVVLPENDSDEQMQSQSEPAAVFGGIKPPSLRVGQLSRQYGVKRLVTSGQLIALTEGTAETTKTTYGNVLNPSKKSKSSKSVTYAEIAIDEEEISPLTEAISICTSMTCIVRSGRPEAEIEESFTREGLVPVITTATTVDAYSELTDEALIDAATGQLHFYYFPPDRVPDHWLTDPAVVYGRVVSRSLRRGSPITETDLLPAGTKPGISAGVPQGMVAMTINSDQISGFSNLVHGDRFAIHAKMPDSVASPTDSSWVTLQGGAIDPNTERLEQMLSTGIREVVPRAIFLKANEDGIATIAVPEDRIAEFAQLVRDKVELFVVAQGIHGEGIHGELSTQLNERSSSTIVAQTSAEAITERKASDANNAVHLITAQSERPSGNANVQVPILTRDVAAFEKLQVQDFIDPATGQFRYVFFPQDKLKPEWVTDVRELIDRVVIRDVKSGRTISSGDLAAKNSPAGPSAGVEPGMEGVLVDSAQIEDLDLLQPGARFDIVLGTAFDARQLGDQVRRVVSSSDAQAEADKLSDIGIPISRTIVSGAVLLAATGDIERHQQIVVHDRTEKRATLAGGIETVTIDENPRIESESALVKRFVISVPKSQAARLISFLDRTRPLRVALSSANDLQSETKPNRDTTNQGENGSSSKTIQTFVREHFNGEEAPYTEVFVSDNDYSHRTKVSSHQMQAKGRVDE